MKTRWKILIAVGIFALIMAASLTLSLHVQPADELEAYKKLLRAKGEKLTLAELRTPPVPPEDNAAPAVEEAFQKIGPDIKDISYSLHAVAPGKALIASIQADVRGLDFNNGRGFTNSWDDLAAEVQSNSEAISLLHQILGGKKLDFWPNNAYKMFVADTWQLEQAKHALDAAILVNLYNGNIGEALTNNFILLALFNEMMGIGPPTYYFVRLSIISVAIGSTWEILQATNLSNSQLVLLQKNWERMNFLENGESAIVSSRAWSAGEIGKARAMHLKLSSEFSDTYRDHSWESFSYNTRNYIGESIWQSSWSFSAEYRMLKSSQISLETIRAMEINQSEFYKRDYDAMLPPLMNLGVTNAGKAVFKALRIPDFEGGFEDISLSNIIHRTVLMETAKHVVVTAIALKRFQLKYGNLPETITNLVPEFISDVPVDPYDGNSLKYHPNADGTFALYSVGENGKDDGGDATDSTGGTNVLDWLNPKARDWVWPQPATAAEVEAFYARPGTP